MEDLYVGVDLGGTKIYTALANEKGEILKESILKTEAEKGVNHIVNNIKKSIYDVLENISKEEIKSIGIGSPGPIDIKNGLIAEPANLPFKNYNIVKKLNDEFKIKVFLDNDANVATLAEYMFGSGKGTENMIYVTVSTGIGGGAILNGKIYRGSTSNALEIGHTTINLNGTRCGCGNRGCVESMASGTAISKNAKDALKSRVQTSLRNYENITAKEVFIEAEKGDRISKEILEECLSYLGTSIANIANIFDPDVIVIGGGVTNGGNVLFDKVNKEMERRCLGPILKNCSIKKSELDEKVGVLGAIALAMSGK